ncbi:MAG: NTP transferase domain-containing protein [Deltaproteobacteria bacterium]|nr:NTP transferase domain-containing protein [Deltaproteobacteria bacterium]
MKCLIIAAGRGERLKQKGAPKPLIPVLGLPMIARVIHTATRAGVDDFFVVTGYEGKKLQTYLKSLARERELRITCLENPDWTRENGLSVLRAREVIREPFLLLMADHLAEERTLKRLMEAGPVEGGVRLVVDRRCENALVDLSDATKVRIEGERVVQIGKDLSEYDALDTGIFLCTPAIFEAIETSIQKYDDSSLSGGVRVLAEQGRVSILEMGEDFWIDIDDVFALQRAERILLKKGGKTTDGPVARFLNRPSSLWITRRIVSYPTLSPNILTFVSFLISLIAALSFLVCRPWALVTGGILAQFASIVDGCDGEVARLTYRESDFGKWLDAVLDRYADGLLIAGITTYCLCTGGGWEILGAGFLALVGSFVVSYTADKYDGLMKQKIIRSNLRVGRDTRVFILFLSSIFLVPSWGLWFLAIAMNLEVIRRIFVVYQNR